MPLRIGIDARDLSERPTGVGRYVASLLAQWLKSTDHRFFLYSTRPVFLRGGENAQVQSRVFRARTALGWEHLSLPRALRADSVDVFLGPSYSCPLFWGGPTVVAMHDVSFFARPKEFGTLQGMRLRFFARRAAAQAQAFVACSEFTRSEIGRFIGPQAAAKTATILLGPDDTLPPGPDRSRAREALGVNGPYIITVGSIFPRRNIPCLIEAFAAIHQKDPTARLDIIGDNRCAGVVNPERLASTHGISQSVRAMGFVTDEELAARYAAADVAVFLSDYEGFGLGVLEALARRVPTVIANRPSQSELFADACITVNPNPPEVAAAVERVLLSEKEREAMVRRGLEVARRFTWERTAHETVKVIERAVKR